MTYIYVPLHSLSIVVDTNTRANRINFVHKNISSTVCTYNVCICHYPIDMIQLFSDYPGPFGFPFYPVKLHTSS